MEKKQFTDQMGFSSAYNYPPQRIISLVPSITELLFDLGLGEKIVGVTKFCVHPERKVNGLPKIGGTKDFSIEKIVALKPDLVIGNKEENEKDGILNLQKKVPVWMCDVGDLNDLLIMIKQVGLLTGCKEQAKALSDVITVNLKKIIPINTASVAYLIWQKPYMTVGGDTFINCVLEKLGFSNVFSHLRRYPVVSMEDILSKAPDYLFLSTEPYPFKQIHIEQFQGILSKSKVILVDGEMFSWYGSRVRHLPDYYEVLKREINIT
ncbi:MAG: helical backbone metal receptor [Cytophagaceae bacterium]